MTKNSAVDSERFEDRSPGPRLDPVDPYGFDRDRAHSRAQPQVDALDSAAATADPSPAEIAREAYAIYMAEGEVHGHDVDHWLSAEQALRRRRRQAAGAAPPGDADGVDS